MTEAKLIDCMEYMKTVPDKYFDLAIVDPPYGGGGKEQDGTALVGGVLNSGQPKTAHASVEGLTATLTTSRGGTLRKIRAERTGGTWAKRYQSADYL